MKKLSPKEEELMEVVWKLKQAFVKDLIPRLPDPKPHYNTVSTMIRNLEEKGFIGHVQYGNTYQYHPLCSKEEYKNTFIANLSASLVDRFDNSYKKLVSFFAQQEKISAQDLEEILQMIHKQKQSK
ncbi:BlaI/MecI/CopY family transcriptional regulator [Rhodocytophaga rosea]|uniref:BlaI/MecI/CopY family transcriptional regulator n=1 Tax=Rhodocytophaga rosea TaxID=2704465 RepID=A0A6C0GF95_9BACT|nr:BlaI/MecI/CopY family transcriptional regulator [Rhodocytophaga rosea]QHT66402.1 BlaI/MecI/CopY family transcriptional regulator [Rhodocytophaga rosea]